MGKKIMKKRMLSGCIAAIFVLSGCGSSGAEGAYTGYKDAYQAMTEAGSVSVDVSLDLKTSSESVEANGNLKMSSAGEMYYEMAVNDTNVVQFVKDGTLYQEINGEKSKYSTSEKRSEKPETAQDDGKKQEGSGFNLTAFMEEFATMLEAGKIKEMGLLDPIPENVISGITVSDSDSGKTYELDMPDSFVEKLFNVMIEDQVSDQAYALQFSNLEDFKCTMHENDKGVLDGMHYSGVTDVTVPAALNGEEEVIHLDIILELSVENPGQAVEIPSPDTAGY